MLYGQPQHLFLFFYVSGLSNSVQDEQSLFAFVNVLIAHVCNPCYYIIAPFYIWHYIYIYVILCSFKEYLNIIKLFFFFWFFFQAITIKYLGITVVHQRYHFRPLLPYSHSEFSRASTATMVLLPIFLTPS